ncbi:Glucanosyltransferase-domain-containing protein [Cokeromyces recurvatus]|uniref:Glucanosyltransferase-domain-containing protein n=1 Tax=Cokeromyces recurvatus TaxID=90255 RepID=UPI00221FB85E|nr:Glucanosyltransferase-domain-containing protein [Cokeromyces recurvatus]KAI7900684.1 Glucanosyltransferase-domain-containing protein [Cokeromyces recurvatus]
MKISATILILTCTINSIFALNPIVIKGSKFFDSVTKDQFFIKGVAYQPRSQWINNTTDPLVDKDACERDAQLMAELGTNVLRVYEVDPKKNHDACMKAFADAGIYLLLDIATPHFSVNRKNPEYDIHLYNAYKASIDAFIKYDNLLGFIAGNEVTNDKTNTQASAYVKAVIRDTKHYVKSIKSRSIPIGYASNDDEFIRDAIKDYFNCGDIESQADFFGLNLYEWCGASSFERSGFKDRTKELEGYNKPVFLSEYGCNLITPREFSEVSAIYGPEMTGVWSGGIVYEWTQENNRYGLVKIKSSGEAEKMEDYNNLQERMAKVKPHGVRMDDYHDEKPNSNCPSISENWKASNELPPTPSEGACQCMMENLHCAVSDKISMSMDGNNTIGKQLDTMCGVVSCSEISGDAENGVYGAFSFCSPREKLSWLYNLKGIEMKKLSPVGFCDYNGFGQMKSPVRNNFNECAKIAPNMNSNYSEEITKSTSSAYKKNNNGVFITSALCILIVASFI